ncbi:MAG: UBP-type zinc finger domain-containing protein [Candidatus Limnocylindria bacterium]
MSAPPGCCDSQAGHGRIHSDETGHRIIYADPKGGGFIWCYTDNRYL